MKPVKYSVFIKDLLNNPSITAPERERVVELLLKERDKGFVTEKQVRGIIEKYGFVTEVQLRKLCDQFKDYGKKDSQETNQYNYPKPKQTYEFLSSFAQNDGGLKNLTHDFNNGYIEYETFMDRCKEEFEEARRRFPEVPNSIIRRIEEFAFKTSPNWYIRLGKEKKEIHLGWSEPSFVNWYKTNRIHPSKDSSYNSEMIIPFKNSIQVRADNGNLIELLNSLIKVAFGENPCCEVEITKNVNSAQFYTDVDRLGQAIYQIFSTIKDYSEKNFCGKVMVDYNTDSTFKILTITHIGSLPSKKSDDKDYLGGDGNAIKKALNGLCNYEIRAVFPDGAYRLIVLSDNKDEYKTGRFPVDGESVLGYTHVMKFY